MKPVKSTGKTSPQPLVKSVSCAISIVNVLNNDHLQVLITVNCM